VSAIWAAHVVDGTLEGQPCRRAVVVAGNSHPDGSLLDLDALELGPDELLVCEALLDPQTHEPRRLLLGQLAGPAAEGLWFAGQPQRDGDVDAMVLVAFRSATVPTGTVVSAADFRELRVSSVEQVGAVRWWVHNGVLHQVYVQPAHRRAGLGRALVLAASAYRAGRRWPALQVGGTRTELGEAALHSAPDFFRHRVAPLSHVHDPMTPEAD
jgi:GNAT superfamily N-acetyltransferase